MTREEKLIALVTEAVARLNSRVVVLESAPQIIERVVEPTETPPDVIRTFVEAYIRTNPPKDGEDGQDASYEDIQQAVSAYLTANPPKDGRDGKDGADGNDGVSVTGAEIADGLLALSFSDGSVVPVGRVVGRDGKDGTDGRNGADGRDGERGADGTDGADGRGIDNAEINDDGHLILTYSDGVEQDVGRVVSEAVTNTVTEIIKSGGKGKQQIFVNEEPAIDYPALSFVAENDGYFSMRLNYVG